MKKLFLFFLCVTSLHAKCKSFEDNPIIGELTFQIRNPKTNQQEFRNSVSKLGEYLAFILASDLKTKKIDIKTLMNATASCNVVDENIVLVTILRAGLPMLEGAQKIFPDANCGFLAIARDETTAIAKTFYTGIPNITGKCVIIPDVMLATGGSLINTLKEIESAKPAKIIIICAIAAKQGIERILQHNPNIEIYAAAVDPILDSRAYIVPGLGDAGDRSFGEKVITHQVP